MAVELAGSWKMDLRYGPDWVFVRLLIPESQIREKVALAEAVWDLMQRQFVHRVVLELDDLPQFPEHLISQLVQLHEQVQADGGVMRICGLSDENQSLLYSARLDDRFPPYANCAEAVRGGLPCKPR